MAYVCIASLAFVRSAAARRMLATVDADQTWWPRKSASQNLSFFVIGPPVLYSTDKLPVITAYHHSSLLFCVSVIAICRLGVLTLEFWARKLEYAVKNSLVYTVKLESSFTSFLVSVSDGGLRCSIHQILIKSTVTIWLTSHRLSMALLALYCV